jgi:hypothetical protein
VAAQQEFVCFADHFQESPACDGSQILVVVLDKIPFRLAGALAGDLDLWRQKSSFPPILHWLNQP